MNSRKLSMLKEQAKTNAYVAHGDIIDADCVIGFSFGYVESNNEISPGKSNEQLAAFIEQRFSAAPLILQSEINNALTNLESALVIHESRKKGQYLNSREFAEQALLFMKKQGWSKAIIITHPAMEARNDAICTKLGIETVTPKGLEIIEYDENSAQPWTRNKSAWWKRESGVIDQCAQNDWL